MALASFTTTTFAGVLLLTITAGSAAAAIRRHHVVGGDPGWAVASDVLAWSAGRLFTVGDTLWFAYSAEDGDSVAEVGGEEEFDSCDAGSPVRMYTEGLSRVDLDGEGSRYFVSADPAKCGGGLKLRADVRAPVAGMTTSTPAAPLGELDDRTAPAPAPWASSCGRGVATSRTCVMLCCLLFLAV